MARFAEHFVHQVQQATDIVELVSRYVALKRRGKEFIGLCPFHDDKKPSLNVSPTKQIFKCFACGAGGTAFNFLMLYDKVSFPEAIRTLAERANIPLPRDGVAATSAQDQGLSKADLAEATAFAMDFFRGQLHSPAGAAALEYARGRGLTDESIERFSLGYAPDSWEAMYRAGRQAGFSEARLVAAGLVARREGPAGGCYDRFRNRLMFPIFDLSGRVAAFGGRALAADERAKYLNSPETPLFDKSGQLFAMNRARERIVASGQAVVVEGYLDALIPHQEGVDNVVATLGTALTDRHVRLLARYAGEVVLIFDADAAGAAAAQRALEVFLSQQVHVRVASIAEGKDPCDYCLSHGGDALRALVSGAPDALEYAWRRRQAELTEAGGNLTDRRRVVEDFLRLIMACSTYGAIDEVRRGQLAQHIGHLLNVAPADLQQLMRRLGRRPRAAAATLQGDDVSPPVQMDMAEKHILEVLLNQGDLFDTVAERIDPEDFTHPELRAVAENFWRLGAAGRGGLENLLSCEAMAELGALVAGLATAGQTRGNYEKTLDGAVEALLYRRERDRLQQVKSNGYQSDQSLRALQQRLRNDVRRRPSIR